MPTKSAVSWPTTTSALATCASAPTKLELYKTNQSEEQTVSVLDRFRLDGRTAIVTGIGPGVGEHVAKAYAELGANVVCASRNAGNYQRVAQEINDAGGNAIGVACDVGDKAQLDNLVARARDAFGPIHIL